MSDFPWAASRFVDVSRNILRASIGPNGKRALFESRGEIFTVPAEKGDARNITRSSGAADHAPVWSPDGARIAWFSDEGNGYRLLVGDADGLGKPREISIGDVKMAWNPSWSPDGNHIAFTDDVARLRVLTVRHRTSGRQLACHLTHQLLLVYILRVPTTSATDFTTAARLFHALSDETRLAILEMLQDGERCVCDLQGELDAAQSRLSFHLKVLREAGLVTDRKEGRWSYYTIVPDSLATIHDLVVGMRPSHLGGHRRLPVNARCCG